MNGTGWGRGCRLAFGVGLLVIVQACAQVPPRSACPVLPQDHVPPADAPLNFNTMVDQLKKYHDTYYAADQAAVFAVADSYVAGRLGRAPNPVVVLDIDETSLSNYEALVANQFAFFPKAAACRIPSNEACGFAKWIDQARAPAIAPALNFFNSMKARGVAVFFVTARLESQRAVTIRNLQAVGYGGWAELVMKQDTDTTPARPFKTQAREQIQATGHTIANIGDQDSDFDHGRAAECTFKLPNPFYLIP
jgi:predicted secreted acid phosphatase